MHATKLWGWLCVMCCPQSCHTGPTSVLCVSGEVLTFLFFPLVFVVNFDIFSCIITYIVFIQEVRWTAINELAAVLFWYVQSMSCMLLALSPSSPHPFSFTLFQKFTTATDQRTSCLHWHQEGRLAEIVWMMTAKNHSIFPHSLFLLYLPSLRLHVFLLFYFSSFFNFSFISFYLFHFFLFLLSVLFFDDVISWNTSAPL